MNREKRRCHGDNENPLERVSAERCLIWTVGTDNWEKSEKGINATKGDYNTENDASDRAIGGKEEVDETCEEEEHSHVE